MRILIQILNVMTQQRTTGGYYKLIILVFANLYEFFLSHFIQYLRQIYEERVSI